jgi:hypothetical protein
VAYIALFVALGGTGYAALSIPAGSVGRRQLRNGAVTSRKIANNSVSPSKLDSDLIGGSIRYWAYIDQHGETISGSRGVRSSGPGPIYHVNWGTRFSSRCAALVTPAGAPGSAPIADSTGVTITQPSTSTGSTVVYVWTYSSGTLTPAPFYLAVIC